MNLLFKIISISLLIICCSNSDKKKDINFSNVSKAEIFQSEQFEFSLIAVGDIMLGSGYPSESYLAPQNGLHLLDSAAELIKSADIAFGNLEGAIIDTGNSKKECSGVCYYFRMKEIAGSILKNAGFDILNLGNNHSSDFGYSGLRNTQKVLDKHSIKHFGIEEKPYEIIEFKGKKIGFIGFATSTNTINMNNIENCVQHVKALDSIADIVVVSFHGGGEGSKYKHITRETELFLETTRGNPFAFSRAMIDAGADIIIGHGPHVPRAAEIYNNRLIVYSLGNFCTYKQFSLGGTNRYAPMLSAKFNENGEVIDFDFHSFIQKSPGIPVPDKQNNAKKEILRLSAIDFPTSGIHLWKK